VIRYLIQVQDLPQPAAGLPHIMALRIAADVTHKTKRMVNPLPLPASQAAGLEWERAAQVGLLSLANNQQVSEQLVPISAMPGPGPVGLKLSRYYLSSVNHDLWHAAHTHTYIVWAVSIRCLTVPSGYRAHAMSMHTVPHRRCLCS